MTKIPILKSSLQAVSLCLGAPVNGLLNLFFLIVRHMRGLVPRAAPREGGGRLRQGRGEQRRPAARGSGLQVCSLADEITNH